MNGVISVVICKPLKFDEIVENSIDKLQKVVVFRKPPYTIFTSVNAYRSGEISNFFHSQTTECVLLNKTDNIIYLCVTIRPFLQTRHSVIQGKQRSSWARRVPIATGWIFNKNGCDDFVYIWPPLPIKKPSFAHRPPGTVI